MCQYGFRVYGFGSGVSVEGAGAEPGAAVGVLRGFPLSWSCMFRQVWGAGGSGSPVMFPVSLHSVTSLSTPTCAPGAASAHCMCDSIVTLQSECTGFELLPLPPPFPMLLFVFLQVRVLVALFGEKAAWLSKLELSITEKGKEVMRCSNSPAAVCPNAATPTEMYTRELLFLSLLVMPACTTAGWAMQQ